jgi:hypothetical protein
MAAHQQRAQRSGVEVDAPAFGSDPEGLLVGDHVDDDVLAGILQCRPGSDPEWPEHVFQQPGAAQPLGAVEVVDVGHEGLGCGHEDAFRSVLFFDATPRPARTRAFTAYRGIWTANRPRRVTRASPCRYLRSRGRAFAGKTGMPCGPVSYSDTHFPVALAYPASRHTQQNRSGWITP